MLRQLWVICYIDARFHSVLMAGPVTTGHLEEQCHQPFGLGPRVRVIHTAYQCHCHHQYLVQFWLDYCMRVHLWPFHYHHLLLSKFPRTAVAVH